MIIDHNYDAFISYKHNPYISRLAHIVLNKLERYHPPKSFGTQKKKLHICIDDQNLAAGGTLNNQIYAALANSEYLIYLACPETLDSLYCLDEIRYFKKLHDGKLDNIIVLLIKGEPGDVLPQELCYEGCWDPGESPDPERKREIHWLDLRGRSSLQAIKKLNKSLLMIAAPLLHCDPADLIQKDRQWRKQRRMMRGMFGGVMLVIALCAAYTFWLTWLMDYKWQAENALANGNDNKALFYYSKALSMNPMDRQASINARILLQKEPWPVMVKEEADSVILGNRVYPVDTDWPGGGRCLLTPICVTTKGNCVLWTDGDYHYYESDADGNFLEELSDAGSFLYYSNEQGVADAWCFLTNENLCCTFYWPEEKRMEKLRCKEDWDVFNIRALQPGIVAVNDWNAVIFYQLEGDTCRELYRIEFDEIFSDDQLILEEYNISLKENYDFGLWASPDGSQMVITAEFWYSSGARSFCRSAAVLFDTETYCRTALIENQECLIANVTFQNDSQKFALIYNNESSTLERSGCAAVYDCFGHLVFQTEYSSDVVPQKGYFCGKLFLISEPGIVHFLDAETGRQFSEPLLFHVNRVALTDDGQIALQSLKGVSYCCLVKYEGIVEEDPNDDEVLYGFQRKMEMKYQLAEDLWVYVSDNKKEIILASGDSMILDRFLIPETGIDNFIISLDYSGSTHTVFVLDEERNLYFLAIDMESKKFIFEEETDIYGGVLALAPAQNGVIYLDSYFPGYYFSNVSNLRYMTNNNVDDSPIDSIEWIVEPDMDGSFAGLMAGESDYAIIVSIKGEKTNFQILSIETGDFLASMSYVTTDDFFACVTENNILYIRFNGKWDIMWLDHCWADRNITQQLMDLSGYMLFGDRFRNNQVLKPAEVIMPPDVPGGWSEYLGWTYCDLLDQNK